MRCGAAPAISLPAKRIEPERGRKIPAVVIISVVLPAPFGPEQAGDRALLDLKGHASQRLDPAIGSDQVLDFEQRGHQEPPPR
jgi:hypothetical protein